MWRWRWRVLAESLGILQVSVLVKRAEEVVMRGAMTGMEVAVVDTMVLIEMVVDLAGAIEIVVLKEDHEMTAIIRTVLVPMNVVVQETSVQGRKNSPDRAIEDTAVTCWRCQSLFCCISSSWFSKILCCLWCFDAQFRYSYIMIRGFSLKNSEKSFWSQEAVLCN
ncbi:uncharacterized protein LOC104428211 isoform X2 [Eucalyptus grandis]|uniref:uncharacterized protein LOC104428211 isoform X2 n=1 Tax=Eucalyptus grandis TaxID=71139 RepID=UPI00192ECE6D|nr:uncharacterized protein LOC104428211 isoform X2 [Eucalyptus grandis]